MMQKKESTYVYADCAASAPVLQCARDAMNMGFGNPNSVHRDGRIARGFLESARETIARCINAEPEQIAFTPSATAACQYFQRLLDDDDECVMVSRYEHKAVDTISFFLKQGITDGRSCIGYPTIHMLANNETGELFYDRVRDLAYRNRRVFADATAAVGQIPVDVKDLGVAALAAGGHKFGALPGIGFVYVRAGVEDEDTFPGTPPVGLAFGMAKALEYRAEHMKESMEYLYEQRMKLGTELMKIPGCNINSKLLDYLPNILSVRFDGVNARELLTMLDVNGVAASAGSACTADSDEPSRVLLASGLAEEQALSTIRLSFCPETRPEDFVYVADALRLCVEKLRRLSR